jgi:hypothetical protein
MTRRRTKRSAFAAVTAIVLLGLVASMLAAMGIMFAADARRTRDAVADAQLRQLLIAGAADVQQRLDKGQTRFDLKIEAPAEATMQVSAAAADGGDDAIRATVLAHLGTRRRMQTLHFTRDGDRWNLTGVELDS